MKRILVAVVAVAALSLSACGPSCEDACENANKVCNVTTPLITCDAACELVDAFPCSNKDDIFSCQADATTCEAVGNCPDCTP